MAALIVTKRNNFKITISVWRDCGLVARISTHSEVLDLLDNGHIKENNTNKNHKRSPLKQKQRKLNIESWAGSKTRAMVMWEVRYKKGQYLWNITEQPHARPLMTERGPGSCSFEAFVIY